MDVTATRPIPLPPDTVAAYAMDWRHDHEWTQGIRSAELTRKVDTTDGFGLGAEVTRTAHFMGRRIDYVLRVVGYEPPAMLDMESVAGPFPMRVTYRFDPHPAARSRASGCAATRPASTGSPAASCPARCAPTSPKTCATWNGI
jgi:hypothetical protein